MAHQHGRAHMVRRQTQRPRFTEDDEPQVVKTVFAPKTVTLANTFTVPVKWITGGGDSETIIGDPFQPSSAPKATSKARSSSKKAATATASERAKDTSTAKTSPKHTASTIMVATSSPVPTGSGTGAIAGLASATASVALSSASPSSSDAAASSGMSTGAKAGLVFGILVAIGALLGAILFVYHRKKKQLSQDKMDDEKASMRSAPPPPPPQLKPAAAAAAPAPSIMTNRTTSSAPRLSLRPVTQFDPTFAENRKSGGNLLNVAAAAGGHASQSCGSPSPDHPSSAWERPGAGNATNPFNDPQPRSVSPQNPFENASSPATPQSANHPSSDFANPAPAIAAAMVAPVTRRQVPAPSVGEAIPPSPSWTEEIPASPGPAPAGPPPMAVAGGPNGPAPALATNNVYRIQLNFNPSMQDELELIQGQLVRMLHEYDDGWALCMRMDRTQQGVVPRTCLSKHPVKPRTGPPRQGPPGPRMRGPPISSPMGPGGVPQPRPLTPSSGRKSPAQRTSPGAQPPYPVNGRNSPGPRMSPGPQRSMSPGPLRTSPPNMGEPGGRARSNSNAPYAAPQRSMSPGPYGGGPQQQLPPPQMQRPRANSASDASSRRGPTQGPSPMNPNTNAPLQMPARKPLPGQAL